MGFISNEVNIDENYTIGLDGVLENKDLKLHLSKILKDCTYDVMYDVMYDILLNDNRVDNINYNMKIFTSSLIFLIKKINRDINEDVDNENINKKEFKGINVTVSFIEEFGEKKLFNLHLKKKEIEDCDNYEVCESCQ